MHKSNQLTSTPGGLIWAKDFAAPKAAAAPPISTFMVSIEHPGPVFML